MTDLASLALRFSYHIYKSRAISYRYFDQLKEKSFETYPSDIKKILCSAEADAFIDEEIAECKKRNFNILHFWDNAYPKKIRNYKNMPPCLYIEGDLPPEDSYHVAIVGSRKASAYGLSTAHAIARQLAFHNVVIASGMAYGIDTQAHLGALDGKGKTIAVMGCSLDYCYPKSNQRLRSDIAKEGAIISEFPLKTPPAPYLFPVRNRIISALSEAIVVVEAAEKSGALITVDYALDQAKEVYAVPGNITNPLSKGPHQLIKNGAQLFDGVEDFINERLRYSSAGNSIQSCTTGCSAMEPLKISILELLKTQSLSISEVLEQLDEPASEVLNAITFLEIEGYIEQFCGKYTAKS